MTHDDDELSSGGAVLSQNSAFSIPSRISVAKSLQSSNSVEIKVPQQLTQSSDPSNSQEIQSNTNNNQFVPQSVIWGTNVVTEECRKSFKQFIKTFHPTSENNNCERNEDSEEKTKFYMSQLEECSLVGLTCLNLDCMHLKSYDGALYRKLVNYPREILPIFDHVINEVSKSTFNDFHPTETINNRANPDDIVVPLQTRPFNAGQECCRALRLLEPTDLDKLVSINGMITRVSPIIPEMQRAFFECEKCGHFEFVEFGSGSGSRFVEPTICVQCQSQKLFKLIHNKSLFADRQLMKLQEDPSCIPQGETPNSILLAVHDDLIDVVQAGDRVTICGIYKAWSVKPNPRNSTIRSVCRTFVDVLHFEKATILNSSTIHDHQNTNININNRHLLSFADDQDVNAFFSDKDLNRIKEISELPDVVDRLAECLAPGVFGYHEIKKGLLLQLLGGTNKRRIDETTQQHESLRSEINILLCGDPGTSKSQLLKYIYDLMPRSQYTSGKGSSAVGLTAYVTKDPDTKNLVLQSGALVLADNGICCIDEFDKMSDHVRSILHEVMEQQTMSIAKAGIICTLNARVAILAAANPVDSHWNHKKTIIDNLQLPSTLLSRFDLIFLVLDPQSEDHDRNLASHLVSLFTNMSNGKIYHTRTELSRPDQITEDDLKMYITYSKANIRPKLSSAASEALIASYVDMRQLSNSQGHISAFPRQLESLIRLSEAHAKCRLSNIVTEEDVQQAITLHKEAIRQSATDPTTGKIDISILTTGLSTYKRKIQREIANSIRQIIDSIGRSRLSGSDIYENLSSNSDIIVKRADFDNALKILESEGYIRCNSNGDIRVVLNSI